MPTRLKICLTLITVGLIVLVCPFIGPHKISPGEIFMGGMSGEIFWNMRVPRVILAFLTGATLAVGGLVFQALFLNMLATPFTLGVSSGAAFGAALYVKLGLSFAVLSIGGSYFFALAGALLTIVLLLTLAAGKNSALTMLLSGVVINFFFSSLILFMQYLSDFTETFRITRWLMGGFDTVGYHGVFAVVPFVLFGVTGILVHVRELDLLCLGSEFANSRGVDVRRVELILLLCTSLMVGGVVALAGPIGFIGIIVPYVARLLVGYRHTVLMPVVLLGGGVFLVICDTVARVVISPFEMPVGVITALLGAPFFLWLMRRKVLI